MLIYIREDTLTEVCYSKPISLYQLYLGNILICYLHLDIHLRNILIRLPSQLDQLPIDQLYKEYGEPETVIVTRTDGKPLTPNVPEMAAVPLNLAGKKLAEEFTLADTRILLNDFGEAYAPAASEPPHLGRDCHTPLGSRPPEARFEPDAPLSYPSDIWGLALAIWEILGMKAMFSNEFTTLDEVTAQQVDVLGPMPSSWWDSWDEKAWLFSEDGRPLEDRWPTLDVAFEEFVQKFRRKWPEVGIFGNDEAAAILDLMRRMLAFRPEERLTAEEVLRSEWMRRWVLPDVERSRGGGGVD